MPALREVLGRIRPGGEVNAGAPTVHRIRHYVYGVAGDRSTLIPRESGMRGPWPCEAKCSCGWETRTGGAVRSFVDAQVASHKFDVEHGFWKGGAS